MRALVKAEAAPGIWMREVEKPTLGPLDVLIKIKKTAICGTDIHIYRWDEWAQKTVALNMPVGHEFSGEIVELGSAVKGYHVGQRVSGEGHLTCGLCRNCRAGRRKLCRNTVGIGYDTNGAFADYLVLPASNIFPLPDFISDDLGAILDPFGNATHTTLAFPLVGEDVLITGAGPIGIMAIAVAKKAGARQVVITDVNPYRLELAKKMGATRAIDVSKESIADCMEPLSIVEGFDVGLEVSGNPQAFSDMISVMNHGGGVSLLGLLPSSTQVDWDAVVFKSLTLKGIYGREIFETWYRMVAMIKSGLDVSPIITHHFPVEEYQQAFELMDSGQSGKVILSWD